MNPTWHDEVMAAGKAMVLPDEVGPVLDQLTASVRDAIREAGIPTTPGVMAGVMAGIIVGHSFAERGWPSASLAVIFQKMYYEMFRTPTLDKQ